MIHSLTVTWPDEDKFISNMDSDLYDMDVVQPEQHEIVLTDPLSCGFVVKNIDGLGAPDTNIVMTEVAGFDGGLFNSASSRARTITITLIPWDVQDVEHNRHKAYRWFPIKKKIRLIFKTDERHVFIDGFVQDCDVNMFGSKASDLEKVVISISCPTPWFYDMAIGQSVIYGIEPMFSFPFESIAREYYDGYVYWQYEDQIHVNFNMEYSATEQIEDQLFNVNLTKEDLKSEGFENAEIELLRKDITDYVYPDTFLPIQGVRDYDLINGVIVKELPDISAVPDKTKKYYLDITPSHIDDGSFIYEEYRIEKNGVIVDELPEIQNGDYTKTYYQKLKPGESIAIKYRSYKIVNGEWALGRYYYDEDESKLPIVDDWYFTETIKTDPPTQTGVDTISPVVEHRIITSEWLRDSFEDWGWKLNEKYPIKVFREYPEDKDLIMGIIKNTAYDAVWYDGEVDIGAIFKIHASGDAKSIAIFDFDTNEYMKIDTDSFAAIDEIGAKKKLTAGLHKADDIILSTVKGDKYAYLFRNGEYYDIIGSIDRTSTWFQMNQGVNYFAIIAEEGIANLRFNVDHYVAYEGL